MVGDDYLIIAITNTHSIKKSIDAFDIKTDKSLGKLNEAVLYTKDGEEKCVIDDTVVKVPGIKTAGYLLIKKEV